MGVLLCCDAPGCFKTIEAVAHMNRPASPPGWLIIGSSERCIVSCCPDHFLPATQTAARQAPLGKAQKEAAA